MENRKIPTSFSVEMYGDLRPYDANPLMSKTRMRSFYKYDNRNGSYFTDEQAEKLIEAATGQPIVGCYDTDVEDFSSHVDIGASKTYGFVPSPSNFAWETHVDKDGVAREYACFDVVLWTHRHKQAKMIPGKPQSMELNPTTVQGEWMVFGEQVYFVYSHTDLMGFCVLGDDVEPCFEGAAFYNKAEEQSQADKQMIAYFNAMREEIRKNFEITPITETEPEEGGKEEMDDKNTVVEQETTTTEETAVSFTAEECALIDEIKGEGTLEDVKAALAAYATLQTDFAAKEQELTDLQTKFDTLSEENGQLKNQITEFENKAEEIEEARKDELIDSFSKDFDEAEIEDFRAKKAEMSYEQLESTIAVNFTRKTKGSERGYVPNPDPVDANNDVEKKSELVSFLEKYKTGKEA